MIFHNCTLYNFVLRYKYKVEIAFSEKTSAIIRQKRIGQRIFPVGKLSFKRIA